MRTKPALGLAIYLGLALASRGPAQAAAQLAGTDAEAARALAALPEASARDDATVAAVVQLLARADVDLRNRAAMWLGNRPEAADAAWPGLVGLRRGADVDAARAAGAVMAALAGHRTVSAAALRAELTSSDPNRRQAAMQKLPRLPDQGLCLLPELVRLDRPFAADQQLRQLHERHADAVAKALGSCLGEPGRRAEQLRLFAELVPDGGGWLPDVARATASEDRETVVAAIEVLGKLLPRRQEVAPILAGLLRDGDRNTRQSVLNCLNQAGPAGEPLWPAVAPLLETRELCSSAAQVLLGLGRAARAHVPELLAALAQADDEVASLLADPLCQLLPDTRPAAADLAARLPRVEPRLAARLLLALGALGGDGVNAAVAACLASPAAEVRRQAVFALGRQRARGELPAITALLQDADADVAAAARFVAAMLQAPARGEVEAAMQPAEPLRALVAMAVLGENQPALAAAVPALARMFVRSSPGPRVPTGDGEAAYLDHLVSIQAIASAADLLQRTGTAALPVLPQLLRELIRLHPQNRLRVYAVVDAASPAALRLLRPLLLHDWQRDEALEHLARLGPSAAPLTGDIAAFVHSPQPTARARAAAALRAIGGEAALQRALALADPWPAYRAAMAANADAEKLRFAVDRDMPLLLRLQVCSALRYLRSPPQVRQELQQLVQLLTEADAELQQAGLDLLSLHVQALRGDDRRLQPRVLAAFAGGNATIRRGLGMALRVAADLPLPVRLARELWSARAADPRDRALQALLQSHDREWLRQIVRGDPDLAARVLPRLPPAGDVVRELVPDLIALLRLGGTAATVAGELLLGCDAGRRALLELEDDPVPDARLLAAVVAAGADGRPFVAAARRQLRALLQARSELALLGAAELARFLAGVRWPAGDPELAAIAADVQELWQRTPPVQRAQVLPLLASLGPAAAFAHQQLVSMLDWQEPATAAAAAEALLALGAAEPVRAWIDRRMADGRSLDLQQLASLPRLRTADAAARAAAAMEAPSLAAIRLLHGLGAEAARLTAAQRSGLLLRTLALLDANVAQAPHLVPLLEAFTVDADADAAAAVEQFLQRRQQGAAAGTPDPLARAVAAAVAPSMPKIAWRAAAAELLTRSEVVERLLQARLATPAQPTGIAAELVAYAVADPARAQQLGQLLRPEFAAVQAPIAALLRERSSLDTGLALLAGLGDAAASMVPDVAAALEALDEPGLPDRFAAIMPLLGPPGIAWLEQRAAGEPAYAAAILRALSSTSPPTLAAAARAVIDVRPAGAAQAVAHALSRTADPATRAWLLLALFATGAPDDEQVWLKVAAVEPALLRKRALEALATLPELSLLQIGVVVELLQDVDSGVRKAALELLLAAPARIAACRQALAEFAAGCGDPALAQRIEAALR